MKRLLSLSAILLCLPVCRVAADTRAIAPVADTYFEAYGSEDRNFGAEPVLRVDQWGGRQALLRFPLNSLPQGRRVLHAALRLYITDVGFNEAGALPDLKTCVGLYDVATPWTETGATFRTYDGAQPWRQGPGIGGPGYNDVGPLPKPDIGLRLRRETIPLDPAKAVKGQWLEMDVTEWLRGRLRASDREVSLLLRGSTLSRNYTFASREAPDAAQRPHLRVETAGVPDFTLDGAFLTDWRPGRRIALTLRSPSPRPAATPLPQRKEGKTVAGSSPSPVPGRRGQGVRAARWSFLARPAGSRVTVAAFKPTAVGVAFVPDAPGLYCVRCVVQVGGGRTTEETAEVYALAVRPHPRLYVTPERLAALRRQAKTGARLATAFLKWVDAGSAGVAKGQFHDLGLPYGCEDNALAYLLTGDTKYADNSLAYARRILEKPMRKHFGDVHGATFEGAFWAHAMACHYDWCFDRLPAAHRRAVAEWLKEEAGWSLARAGRPIAHNDGGGRQVLLASAALALLGDDPAAPDLLRRSHANFRGALLPWLNDGGRGGRSGDGGEYEGLHAFFLVRYAWMARTATGEDVFAQSPFFFNRLKHILFGWYPRKLVERTGRYAIRTYYSPAGDHIRLGYVGDTQPYQSAAALCDRYRATPEARAVRWLAGEWPTEWMQYTLKWAVLGDFDGVPAVPPTPRAYLDTGFQALYARSDWSDDATWLLLEGGPWVSVHQSLYAGGFEIFKGDLLAARTGSLDHANVGAAHSMNYLHRTLATNSLLIHDSQEKWKGFLGGAEGVNDGGGQRTNWPLTSGPDADTYFVYRPVFQRGRVTRYADTMPYTYALADITEAYNSPAFHGGDLNRPKVTSVTRQLLYLRPLDTVLVFDRVRSTDPAFRKTWLLHSLGDLDVQDGRETKVDDGEFRYDGATRAVIRYGWPKPVPSFARCLSVTLLPENARVTKVGGRVDLPEGQAEGFPGDVWHGQHRHMHIKDFWVDGKNYPPGNPPETRWFGEPGSPWYVPGTPDETGGRGKWRLEVSPPAPAKDDVFFHVLCPRLGREGPFPAVRRLSAGPFEGALISENSRAAAVFFARAEARSERFETALPAGWRGGLLVADLAPGDYALRVNGRALAVTVGADGLLWLMDASGAVTAMRKGESR